MAKKNEWALTKFYKVHFLGTEMAVAILVAAAFYFWTEHSSGLHYVGGLVKDNRGAIYGALVSLFGTMLGFSIATISIVISMIFSERLEILRKSKHYPALWKIFTSANWVLALATISALTGLVFDRDRSPIHIIMHINIFYSILSIFRVARCVWVLEKLIGVMTRPEPPPQHTPESKQSDDRR